MPRYAATQHFITQCDRHGQYLADRVWMKITENAAYSNQAFGCAICSVNECRAGAPTFPDKWYDHQFPSTQTHNPEDKQNSRTHSAKQLIIMRCAYQIGMTNWEFRLIRRVLELFNVDSWKDESGSERGIITLLEPTFGKHHNHHHHHPYHMIIMLEHCAGNRTRHTQPNDVHIQAHTETRDRQRERSNLLESKRFGRSVCRSGWPFQMEC